MTKHEYWTLIDEWNWKGRCENKEHRPYETIGDIIAETHPYDILTIQKITKEERTNIINFLNKNGIRTGNDSGWDLTAHIVGCGFDYINEVKDKVNSGEYNENNIYDEIPYRENFQYSIGKAMERIIEKEGLDKSSGNREDVYGEWVKREVRDEKIDSLVD